MYRIFLLVFISFVYFTDTNINEKFYRSIDYFLSDQPTTKFDALTHNGFRLTYKQQGQRCADMILEQGIWSNPVSFINYCFNDNFVQFILDVNHPEIANKLLNTLYSIASYQRNIIYSRTYVHINDVGIYTGYNHTGIASIDPIYLKFQKVLK